MKLYRLLFIVPIVLGLMYFKNSRSQAKPPAKKPKVEISQRVQVTTVRAEALPSRLAGYGSVVADRLWRAVPEIGGRVIYVHPRLQTGERVLKGELLVEIDTRDYVLEQRRIGHENRALEAELEQLDAREKEVRQMLKLARGNVQLSRKDRERYQDLYRAGAIPAAQLDTKTRDVLGQQRAVEDLEATLSTLPAQRRALRARMSAASVAQQRQGLSIERSQVVAPFTGILQRVYLEKTQVVNAGQELFLLQGTDELRVEAQLPAEEFAGFDPLRATVIYAGVPLEAQLLPLRESVDVQSRTVALQLKVRPGNRALLPGSLVEVILEGRARPSYPIIPRTALHDDFVYLVEDGKLAVRKVEVAFRQGDLLAIAAGLKEGEKLVTSDPGFAMEGSPVEVEQLK